MALHQSLGHRGLWRRRERLGGEAFNELRDAVVLVVHGPTQVVGSGFVLRRDILRVERFESVLGNLELGGLAKTALELLSVHVVRIGQSGLYINLWSLYHILTSLSSPFLCSAP